MFDTHCHLFDPPLNAEEIFSKAEDYGLRGVAVVSTTSKSWDKIISSKNSLTRSIPLSVVSIGVHPWFVHEEPSNWYEELEKRVENVNAIGEIGLDKGNRAPDIDLQMKPFILQMDLARKYSLPVLIHSVKTHDLILEYIKKNPGSFGIIHSFSGSPSIAKEYIGAGWLLGVGGGICRENSHRLRRIVKTIPIENLVLETDSPYMGTPKSAPGSSSPLDLLPIAEKLSEIKSISVEEVIKITTENAIKVFNK